MPNDDAPSVAPRGRPFEKGTSGNPAGRPPGARSRTTLAAQALLDGEAEALTRKAVELALGGDLMALRLCLERVIPLRRGQPLDFEIRKLTCMEDATGAIADIVAATASGEITLSEAAEFTKLIELYVKSWETLEKTGAIHSREQRIKEDRQEYKKSPAKSRNRWRI
jgi:uncharacterized protein DUF5681